VRVSAAWALRDSLNLDSTAGKDLQHMLNWNADQPSGQMQLAQFDFARRNTTSAIQHMETAIRWDPNSPPFHHDLAMIYSTTGQTSSPSPNCAMPSNSRPIMPSITTNSASPSRNRRHERPSSHHCRKPCASIRPLARAWYNLGLAKNGQGDISGGAMEALQRGELANPRDPGIPYARATILARLGRKAEALQALDRTLVIQHDHSEALQLKMMLSRQ
jgi:Flp pilus assembly protein TadD